MRITVACPEALTPDANQLAMALGFGYDDAKTYGKPTWQDADGNLYAAASFVASDAWVVAAQSPLVRPEWDAEELIDLVAASRAQAALVYSTNIKPALNTVITAIGDMEGLDALEAMGLTQVPKTDTF